jgi:hypothetical protein
MEIKQRNNGLPKCSITTNYVGMTESNTTDYHVCSLTCQHNLDANIENKNVATARVLP